MAWLVRFIQVACWIEIISMHVNAQQALSLKRFHGPDWQNWDELDLQTRLFSRLDATWVAQGRFSSHLSNPAVGVLGADFNFEVSKYLVITPSYYCFTFRTAAGVEGHGQDPILAATVFARYGALTISDRNRFIGALGITGTQDFWIYGNRPRIDYKIGPDAWKTSLFAWDEIFYFSNHNGWIRNRLAIGGRKALNERTTVNLYYQRQNDDHGSPRVINAVVVLIELRLR
jgi:hypothetical protein